MEIGVISDVHCEDANAATVTDALATVATRFRRDHDLSAVVLLGDLIEDGPDAETDRRNLRRVRDAFSSLECPVVPVLGNHDVATLSPEAVLDVFDRTERWGTFNDVFAYLDTSAPRLDGPRGELTSAQIAFVAESVSALEYPLVFAHHPLHYVPLDDNPWFERYPELAFCGNKRAAQRALDGDDPVVVVSAHLHESHYRHEGARHHVSIGPFAKGSPETGLHRTAATIELGGSITIRTTDTAATRTVDVPI